MKTDLFDFELPEDLIALRPVFPRDAARMLVVRPGGDPELTDGCVRELADLLEPGDCLVFNDTRVISAALTGVRTRGENVARIDCNLHKRLDGNRWRAFARPGKRLAVGERIRFGKAGTSCLPGALEATVEEKEGGEVTLSFDISGPDLDAAIAAAGVMPLPPYIAARRPADADDDAAYQTVYARTDGAVAAPTAGLHFTDALFAGLARRKVAHAFVTLHVGAGTFLPVKADDTDLHRMHAEWGTIVPETAEALNATRAAGGRIVAVGTTSLRLLESAANDDGTIPSWTGDTDIFITPGYRFKAVDALMTNFHLPRSTLFMLVSAFAGLETMQRAYRHAIDARYRFYSYGDSSLLFRSGAAA
ncbi:MAG: tRNA preQ1(34) S-adenosylmethionine ribosyltransferase-isomerase QueA [Alphaproteobacteria bacterium]|nr:tRNA preQ1(34) S-adenosylmethionine ribosyltransferase-isomerase QueA [Alphaproteobacteria bacterium]